jgi:hypothetical protein
VKFALLAAIGLFIGECPAFAACAPLRGAEQIWSNKHIHWVFIGEMHGSNETPAAFLDLICDAVAHGKMVTVALERPMSEQQALTGILSSRDLPSAEKTLLDQPGWKAGVDGRASKAMLQLLLSLRQLRIAHPALNVLAFDKPHGAGDPEGLRDKTMGQTLLAFGKAHPGNLMLILTGNFHAMQAPMHGYDLTAMYVPAAARLSLEVTDAGGESWVESNGTCGPSSGGVEEKGPPHPRGIYLDSQLAPYGKVDGILALGVPLTPSEPADGDSNPLPECRKKFLSENSAGSRK